MSSCFAMLLRLDFFLASFYTKTLLKVIAIQKELRFSYHFPFCFISFYFSLFFSFWLCVFFSFLETFVFFFFLQKPNRHIIWQIWCVKWFVLIEITHLIRLFFYSLYISSSSSHFIHVIGTSGLSSIELIEILHRKCDLVQPISIHEHRCRNDFLEWMIYQSA